MSNKTWVSLSLSHLKAFSLINQTAKLVAVIYKCISSINSVWIWVGDKEEKKKKERKRTGNCSISLQHTECWEIIQRKRPRLLLWPCGLGTPHEVNPGANSPGWTPTCSNFLAHHLPFSACFLFCPLFCPLWKKRLKQNKKKSISLMKKSLFVWRKITNVFSDAFQNHHQV